MSLAIQGVWSPAIDSFHFGRRIAMLLAALAIATAGLAGIYMAAAALAAAMAATISTAETAWRSTADESAPAATQASSAHDRRAVAERNSLGLRSVRWQTDGRRASL